MEDWTDFLSSRQWKSNGPTPTVQSPNDLDTDIDIDTGITRHKSFTESVISTNRLRPFSFENRKFEPKLTEKVIRTASGDVRKSAKFKLKSFGETSGFIQRYIGTRVSDYKTGHYSDKWPCNIPAELNGNTIKSPSDSQPLTQFRRAVRTVQILLRAVTSSRQGDQQHDQEHRSFAQFYDEQSTAKRTYDLVGISFDPTVFRANRERSLSHEGKAVLCMEPSERTEDRLHLAMLALNQTVDAFGEFPIKLQRSLAAVGWYENFEAKRVIIRQGHMADNFYFLLSGTAVVTILETKKETGDQCVRTVAFLRKGNSFGELALMHGARRSATVTCQSDVELLAVRREDFIDIFMHIEQDREPEHIQFLRTVDILRGWPIDTLPNDNPRICLFTYFRRGVLLCRDSNTTEWIYIVKSGSCRVLKDLVETRPNIPGIEYIRYSANIDRFILKSAIEHQNLLNEIFDRRHNQGKYKSSMSGRSVLGSESRSRRTEKVFVQIQKLGPRDTFGLEQTAFRMMGETTGCSLVSDGAECILINRKFFLQYLSDDVAKQIRKSIRPIPTEESLQQKLQDKANWDAYKTMTVSSFVVQRKIVHDLSFDALYF